MADTGTMIATANTAVIPMPVDSPHELWSFSNALVFIILLVIVIMVGITGMSAVSQAKDVTNNWAKYRCNPLVMPFAGMFGYNAKENFEFCMGKVFSAQAQPMLGSITGIFGKFTTVLQSIFHSVNSLQIGRAHV